MRLLTRSFSAALLVAAACIGCGGPDRPREGAGGFDPAPAISALETGDAESALAAALAGIRQAESSAAFHELAEKIETLALDFYDRGEAEAAETLFERALALREREPLAEPEATASLLHDLAGLAFNRGDFAAAERHERHSIERRESVAGPDDPLLAAARRDLGFVYLAQGRLAESESWLLESLAVLERAPLADWFEVALARDYVATLRLMQGDYEEAERIYEALIPAAIERLGEDHPQVAFFVNNLAGIYRDQEHFDRAETLLHRSLTLRRAADPPDDAAIARATLNLAELYRLQGKLADAEPLYIEALALADAAYGRASGERLEFVNQLAVLHRERGRGERAEPLTREALDLAVASLGAAHPRVAQSELDFAELLRAVDRCTEALVHADRAVHIRESVFGREHPEVATALTARARCRAADRDRVREARHDLDRAIAILAGSAAYPGSAADALGLRAALRRRGEPTAARADLAAAVEAVESLRPRRGGGETVRAEFLGSRIELYERLTQWEIEDGSPERGLLAAERGRARALLDQLAAARVGGDPTADEESAARLARARARVGECRARIAFVEAQADASGHEKARELTRLAAQLDDASREFRAAYDRRQNANPAWRAAATPAAASIELMRSAAVPRDGLLLFYATGGETSWLFVVPPPPAKVDALPLVLDGESARLLGVPAGPLTRSALERIVLGDGGILTALTTPAASSASSLRGIGALSTGSGDLDPRLAALYRVLVPAPLRERLTRAVEVVLVPDGPLLALPFEALVISSGNDAASARFWLDDGPAVRYAPSVTFLIALGHSESAHDTRSTALSVSDPDYGTSPTASGPDAQRASLAFDPRGLPRLPGTARETQELRRALAGVADVITLDGPRAREPAVRRELHDKRFIHLATHGLADRGGNALFAALALTPPPGDSLTPEDDGLLELHEIYQLRLDADLAVLSACASNVGHAVAGEGVFALSRGFLVAGASRVVASQWPVDDDATADLVGRLFTALAAGERDGRTLSTATALREAKLGVRRTTGWEHPFFWAPFVLSGKR